jgi:hypothetical protein
MSETGKIVTGRLPRLLRGRAWVWPDDVNTDIIIPFRFKARTNDPVEMAKYAMYGFDPEFYKKVHPGDIFVAGRNFGGGSSREQAPVAIKYSGVSAVIAESIARIFYRNSFAIGLPAFKDGQLHKAKKVPDFLTELVKEGGVVEYYRRHKSFPWERLEKIPVSKSDR